MPINPLLLDGATLTGPMRRALPNIVLILFSQMLGSDKLTSEDQSLIVGPPFLFYLFQAADTGGLFAFLDCFVASK